MIQVNDSTKAAFQGQTILITGASGGLGSALAKAFASCGVSELILTARNEANLKAVENQCLQLNPKIKTHLILSDLSNKDSVKSLGEQALKICSQIDILVNNGGVSSRSNFIDTNLDVDERVMQINFFAGASLAKALVPGMINNQGGRIIWISSVQGKIGIPSRTSYAASKFAVQGYCESLRAELATSGVTVHVASPGYIRTGLSYNAVTGDGGAHGKMDETTLKGAEPDKVAANILDSIARGKNDFIVAADIKTLVAIWLRLLLPSFLERLLVARFEKSQKLKED